MLIGNIKPTKNFLQRLGRRIDNDSFNDCAVRWPANVLPLMRGVGLVDHDGCDNFPVGGKMNIPVVGHCDSMNGNVSVVWFPKVPVGLLFWIGEDRFNVASGDVFLFDHTVQHGVDVVGTWYFMAQDFNRGSL